MNGDVERINQSMVGYHHIECSKASVGRNVDCGVLNRDNGFGYICLEFCVHHHTVTILDIIFNNDPFIAYCIVFKVSVHESVFSSADSDDISIRTILRCLYIDVVISFGEGVEYQQPIASSHSAGNSVKAIVAHYRHVCAAHIITVFICIFIRYKYR